MRPVPQLPPGWWRGEAVHFNNCHDHGRKGTRWVYYYGPHRMIIREDRGLSGRPFSGGFNGVSYRKWVLNKKRPEPQRRTFGSFDAARHCLKGIVADRRRADKP